jgi:hypothetical protein
MPKANKLLREPAKLSPSKGLYIKLGRAGSGKKNVLKPESFVSVTKIRHSMLPYLGIGIR